MSDNLTDPVETPANPETPTGDPNPKPAVEPAQVDTTDWKAEARKWETRAKENSEAAKRLAEIEEQSKTEAQKQAERLAELESKVTEYETREQIAAWAKEVSEETGVPADVLSGSTKEELAAHAEKLKPLIEAAKQEPEPAKPGAVPTIGTTPATPGNVSLADQIAAAEASGDLALARQLKALHLGELSAT